jgi:hypothetical protein
MGKLHDRIVDAVEHERVLVSWHADEQCEERGITAWQLVAGIRGAKLLRERPRSKLNPSIVLLQTLENGSHVQTVWAWLTESDRAILITAYWNE